MKYIDVDKLKAEIERREIILDKYKDSFETAACCKQELEWIKDLISSLQQEQPEVDFKEELDDFISEFYRHYTEYEGQYIKEKDWRYSIEMTARHFYELGRLSNK